MLNRPEYESDQLFGQWCPFPCSPIEFVLIFVGTPVTEERQGDASDNGCSRCFPSPSEGFVRIFAHPVEPFQSGFFLDEGISSHISVGAEMMKMLVKKRNGIPISFPAVRVSR